MGSCSVEDLCGGDVGINSGNMDVGCLAGEKIMNFVEWKRETYKKIQHKRERKRGGVRTTDLFYDGVGGADEESVGDDVVVPAVLKLYEHWTEPAREVFKLPKSEELSGLVDTVVIVGKVAVPDDQPSNATRTLYHVSSTNDRNFRRAVVVFDLQFE
ncbi:hypothetical protein LWI28_015594 [Acer negundo]|uniref:Uncharacterized protein n=1 Tax=Acer negundo TaxID=4023 RepID=A0AAD5IRU0_ACENE|nr:hypothetical protein LWI28_015594 [Acer negundo]